MIYIFLVRLMLQGARNNFQGTFANFRFGESGACLCVVGCGCGGR